MTYFEVATPLNHREKTGDSSRVQSRKRWLARRLIVVVGIVFTIYLARAPLLHAVGSGLVVRDTTRNADFVLVLDGDRCYEEAARLYHEGTVPGILLIESVPSRLVRIGVLPSNEELARRELDKHGVPDAAIDIVGGPATSIWHAARRLEEWLAEHPGDSLIVLCPRFSGRELRWLHSQVLGPDELSRLFWHPLRDRRYDETNWWSRKEGVLSVFNSYVSLGYVWLNGEQQATWYEWDAEEWLAASRQGDRERD
jgi:hypothetical protein